MSSEEQDRDEPVHKGQDFFDEWLLLLIISFFISGLLYNAWGLIELLTLP